MSHDAGTATKQLPKPSDVKVVKAKRKNKAATGKGAGGKRDGNFNKRSVVVPIDEQLRADIAWLRENPRAVLEAREAGVVALSVSKIHRIVDCLAEGNYLETALRLTGIKKSCWFNWITIGKEALKLLEVDPNAELSDRQTVCLYAVHLTNQAKTKSETELASRVYKASEDDWRAGAWMLARRNPERWGQQREKSPNQTNVNVNVSSGVLMVPTMPPQLASQVSVEAAPCGGEVQRLPQLRSQGLIDLQPVDREEMTKARKQGDNG